MRQRLAASAPTMSDGEGLITVLQWHFWLVFALQEAKGTLKRLRALLCGQAPKAPAPASSHAESAGTSDALFCQPEASEVQEAGSEAASGESEAAAEPQPAGGHRLGTGRLGAHASEGAERVECRHEELAAGQRCPGCGQGTLYAFPPQSARRIDGHAVLSALRSTVHRLRCSACGEMCTAPLPEDAGHENYRMRARAVFAVSRSDLGLPFDRLQGYHAMLGVPVPEATQGDQIEQVGDCGYGVLEYLERLAAPGERIHQDDTSVRMLSLIGENLPMRAEAEALGFARPKERTGMSTTALVVQVGAQTICRYDAGRAHAGENLEALGRGRQAKRDKPRVMSDALARNEADETRLMRWHCLAHGRRQCSALADVFPQECQGVIEALTQVFDHDEHARHEQLSPEARLASHQE